MFYLKRDTRATKGHAPESAATKTTHTHTQCQRQGDRQTNRPNKHRRHIVRCNRRPGLRQEQNTEDLNGLTVDVSTRSKALNAPSNGPWRKTTHLIIQATVCIE